MTILCGFYLDFVLILSGILLAIALVVAILETGLAIWAKLQAARKGPVVADSALESVVPAVDPVKLLDALKGLLETLRALPAWIALFLAGVLLFWVAGNLAAEGCAPAAPGADVSPAEETPAEDAEPSKP